MFGLEGKIAKVEYLGFMTKYDLELGPSLNAKIVSYDVLPGTCARKESRWRSFMTPEGYWFIMAI